MRIGVIDIETTGFLKNGGKIVEVGIVELDLETGDKKIVFDEVTHEIGITKEEVSNSCTQKIYGN
jgi:DNA polymerase III epsilon subunit-like protein